jgi:beta-glucanase (GH16 family)
MKRMKKTTILLVILIHFYTATAQSWGLVWSDEFNGTTIDATNWKFETGDGGWGNNELEYYTNRAENAMINKGNLLIIARKEAFSGSNYTSARMKTQGLEHWTYGKIEARIKLPATQGVWPAFWTLGESITTDSWPKCGEIDIMEHINKAPAINGTIHWDNNGHAQFGGDTICDVLKYHVYGVEWSSKAIKWTLDGKKYKEANIANGINGTSEFHQPFFVLLNMAVGGTWPGNPNGTSVFPDTMFVDYVRVYQVTTGISATPTDVLSAIVYPNPGNGNSQLQWNAPVSGVYTIRIVNMHGQLVMQQLATGVKEQTITVNLETERLTSGLYQILVEGNGFKCILKLACVH